MSTTENLGIQMRQLDRKFRRACRQIVILNNKIEGLQSRYDRAYKVNRRSFRYGLRLQLATTEGMRNMYYEYACRRADELETIQDKLVQAGILSETEEDIDWDEDCWIQIPPHPTPPLPTWSSSGPPYPHRNVRLSYNLQLSSWKNL